MLTGRYLKTTSTVFILLLGYLLHGRNKKAVLVAFFVYYIYSCEPTWDELLYEGSLLLSSSLLHIPLGYRTELWTLCSLLQVGELATHPSP